MHALRGALATHFVPTSEVDAALPKMLAALFGHRRRHSVFSVTFTVEGLFLVMDSALHCELFGGNGGESWSCLYIHEASSERSGAEVSGALSTLCDRLAKEQIAVLKEGRVAEQGTHEELLQNPEGLYFNLVLAQSSDA